MCRIVGGGLQVGRDRFVVVATITSASRDDSVPRESAPSPGSPLLELRKVGKRFGPVLALHRVDLALTAGEVTALAGDNGAGKSVLIKTIAGIDPPDSGQIFWEGRPVHIRTPRDAAALGIQTVYQDLALADNLDIVQNMFLGRERTKERLLDEDRSEERRVGKE